MEYTTWYVKFHFLICPTFVALPNNPSYLYHFSCKVLVYVISFFRCQVSIPSPEIIICLRVSLSFKNMAAIFS